MKLLKAGTGTIHGQSGFLVSAGTAGTPANEHSRSLSLCLSHSGNSYPSSLMFCHDFFPSKFCSYPVTGSVTIGVDRMSGGQEKRLLLPLLLFSETFGI